MKKSLIIGLIFIAISIIMLVTANMREKNIHYTNIHDITNSGSKISDAYVSLDVTYVAGTLINDKDYSYYVMFGDGVQFIVYMKNDEATKIQTYLMNNTEESYHITGVSKIIPTKLEENGKKFIKVWLDNNHTHAEGEEHSHDVSTEDFYKYFGYIYLDNTVREGVVDKIIVAITGIIGVVSLVYCANTKYHFL